MPLILVSNVPGMEASARGYGDAHPPGMSPPERERYARHLLLPGVGVAGQNRLAGAQVLVVGAGGLGSPVLTYLAAAGVGVLGVVDDDVVDVTNLQRQVVHGTSDLGRDKVDSAADRITDINPYVVVQRHRERLTAATAEGLLSGYDVVVDATDNFPARYLLSDACVLVGRPLVWGAVARFDGQVSVWWPGRGPCYRCVFPRPPAPGTVPSCAEGGVLGVLPGVIGTLQAVEVLKILLDIGDPLVGRMMVYDALSARVAEVPVARRPSCPTCASGSRVRLVDLDQICVTSAGRSAAPAVVSELSEVTPAQAATLLMGETPPILVDVREAAERDIVTLAAPEQVWVPLGHLREAASLPGVPLGRDLLVYCRSGVRSAEAVALLHAAGYLGAVNVTGGLLRWRDEVDPDIPAY